MAWLKKLLFLGLAFPLLALSLFLFLTLPAFASDEFDTTYEITYSVNADASVSVEQKINLTNKLANVYASQYQISLGTTRVRAVWAKDNLGDLTPQVEKRENTSIIKLEFGQKIVGKGKTLSFSFGYISDDYALRNGRVLEVGIPKIAEVEKLSDYKVNLIIPYLFEEPAFILPLPTKVTRLQNGRLYFFNKQQLGNQSITAAFGNFQVFNFDLKYHLSNKNNFPVSVEISLPPDTPFQKLYYETINPLPLEIKIDSDGNWLALYKLATKQNLEVNATGSAEIFMNPQKDFPSQELTNPQDYLSSQKFWETKDLGIKELANKLKTAKNIYDFVINNLLYDYGRVNQSPQRLGATQALKNKDSVICMEFTDLFIALARAAGIPAREVNGFAYTNNPKLRPLSLKQDILHAWPQYYDEQRKLWINIDPTWGNTTAGIDFFNKLDLNHFAFVFHGLNSQLPLAAGSYKNQDTEEKDIQVVFGHKPKEKINLGVEFKFPKKNIAGLPIKGSILITNKGNTTLYNENFFLAAKDLGLEKQEFPTTLLLPFGTFEKEIWLPTTTLLRGGEKEINLEWRKQQYSYQIQIKSLLPEKTPKFILKIYSWLLALISKWFKIK